MFSGILKKVRLQKAVFAGLVAVLLAVSCDQPTNSGGDPLNAQQPSITAQPQSGTWNVEDDNEFTLTVTASVTDGGTLAYQWYKNTTNATTGGETIGTDDSTITLAKTDYTGNGAYYFYVVVTNTITDNGDGGTKTATATSNAATVTVSGARVIGTYKPGEQPFEEFMGFLEGQWSSSYDGYLVRKWGNVNDADRSIVEEFFPEIDADNLVTYDTQVEPQSASYIYAYLDEYGFMGYIGLVRAINFFDDDGWGAVIIEYFEGGDPPWLAYEGLEPGEKPYFGIYFQVNSPDNVGMANAVILEELSTGNPYHTEQATLEAAINLNTLENRNAFISYENVTPQYRQ